MNRIFNEGVSSSVSRGVSGVNVGVVPVNSVSGQCRKSCDIQNKTNANSLANKRPNNDTSNQIKISFNGIFESKPRSEGSVASDSTLSPVVSPMVAVNHNSRQSPTLTNNDHNSRDDETRDDDNYSFNVVHQRRGRKRKVKEVLDPLKDKFDVRRRIQKSQTTEELAQKFNIEVKLNDNRDKDEVNNRIVATIRTNRRHNKKVSEVEVDDNTTESKSELMQRFLSSQSSTTSPHNNEDINDYSYNSISEQQVISAQSNTCGQYSSQHSYPFITNTSIEQTSIESHAYPSQQQPNTSSYHQKTDTIGDEIKDILSHLPPLYVNDIIWSDCEEQQNDNNSSDNEFNSSEDNIRDDNNRVNTNSDLELETNNDSNNSNNNNNNININLTKNTTKLKETVSDYEVEKYCEQKWEYVSGTYDADTEWRPWNQMTSALSYNGDILHILPYVDINDNNEYICQ